MLVCLGREPMVMAPPSMCDSAVLPYFYGCQAFLRRHFPPQSPPSITLSVVNSSPRPWIAPQSLNSSSQPLHLPGIYVPVWGMNGCGKDCLILIPFRLPQTSCSTLSLKCFSSDSAIAPMWDSDPCFSSPTCQGQV